MKRLAMTLILASGIAAGPVMADHEGGNLLNRENVGGAIGAAIGGFAANKIVDGDGQSAATAAGAVGGFLLGKNFAGNYDRNTHSAPRYSSGGYNGDHQYRRDTGYGNRHGSRRHRNNPGHDTDVATTTSNVRAGPGTRYHVVNQVRAHDRVQVVGKVRGRNWYKVTTGHRSGFVYAPLLRPTH